MTYAKSVSRFRDKIKGELSHIEGRKADVGNWGLSEESQFVQGVMEEINKRKGRFADPDVDEDDEDHKRPPPPPSPRVQRRKRSGNIEERTKDILQRYGHVLRAKPVSRKAEQEEKRDLQTYPPNKRQKNQVRTTDLSKEEVTHFLF